MSMNFEKSVVIWEEAGRFWAEWSDRALDDDERNDPGALKIVASGDTYEEARDNLIYVYDEWLSSR